VGSFDMSSFDRSNLACCSSRLDWAVVDTAGCSSTTGVSRGGRGGVVGGTGGRGLVHLDRVDWAGCNMQGRVLQGKLAAVTAAAAAAAPALTAAAVCAWLVELHAYSMGSLMTVCSPERYKR
jgi:hypothetical protein